MKLYVHSLVDNLKSSTKIHDATIRFIDSWQLCHLAFFTFFCLRYNPLWVLAFLVIFFHSVLSLHSFLHPLIPIVWISSSTSSINLFLGLPLIRLPIGFHSNILLGILPPSIRITCPRQAIFLLFINLKMSARHLALLNQNAQITSCQSV